MNWFRLLAAPSFGAATAIMVACLPSIAKAEQHADTAAATLASDPESLNSWFDRAKGFYEKSKYAEAFALLHPLALRGHPDALFLTGLMAFHGLGRPIDYTEAAEWFLKASDMEIGRARHFLGLMYRDGIGLEQNNVLSLMWFILAEQEGVMLAGNEARRLEKDLAAFEISRANTLAKTYLAGLKDIATPDNADSSSPEGQLALKPPTETESPAPSRLRNGVLFLPPPDTPLVTAAPLPKPDIPAESVPSNGSSGDPAPTSTAETTPETAALSSASTAINPAAPTIPAPDPVIPTTSWKIQIGVFGNLHNAEKLVARLQSDGFVVENRLINRSGRDLARIRIIDVKDQVTANAIKAKIDRNLGLNSKVLGP